MVERRRFLSKLLIVSTVLVFVCVYRVLTKGYYSDEKSFQVCQPSAVTFLDWPTIRQMEIEYWRTIDVNRMTPQQIIDYFHWSNGSSCKLTHDFGGFLRIQPEGFDGQKALCLDPEVRPEPEKCLVYSFGIGNDFSFDEALEQYGCNEIFSFDPTLGAESHFHSKLNRFYDIGLGSHNHIADKNWAIRTLSSIHNILIPTHGDKIIDYLKIDIEGHEWDAIPQMISSGMLNKVRQMTVEFHLPSNSSLQEYRKMVAVVKSLEDAGMIRFDSKLNPWVMENVAVLDNYYGSLAFEIAFYHILPR